MYSARCARQLVVLPLLAPGCSVLLHAMYGPTNAWVAQACTRHVVRHMQGKRAARMQRQESCTTATEPFTTSAIAHCRLTWSPDGQVLAAARGYRDGRNVAPLISRSDWSCDHCYVGHKGPVTVAAFNPKMYFSRKRPASEEAFRVCAVGSHDRATSVWHADEASPVTTIKSEWLGAGLQAWLAGAAAHAARCGAHHVLRCCSLAHAACGP